MAWVPLESNPDVSKINFQKLNQSDERHFTITKSSVMNALLHKTGVSKKIQVVDVFSLDPELLPIVPQPVLAVLLLFPCDDKYEAHKSKQEQELKEKGQVISDKLYFLKQYVHNACGTIALIHSIANIDNAYLEDGILKKFIDDTRNLTPDERGEKLEKCEAIINAHSGVANEGQTAPPDNREPVLYHFVAFIQKEGSLYELDGRKSFPINHGPSSPETFLQDAAKACLAYMGRDPGNVNFTVVAITAD